MNTVSSASITGMVVSLILCVAAPVALCILLKRKTAAKLSDMFLGVVIFILFARFLEQLLHMAMLSAFGERLTGNLWLSALYGGAAAYRHEVSAGQPAGKGYRPDVRRRPRRH